MAFECPAKVRDVLQRGVVIPAHPLALDANRTLDVRRQRALSRYYIAAGAGGLAVGVHTTQFAIRDKGVDLFKPVLELAAEEIARADANRREPLVRVAGICGATDQAVAEAELAGGTGLSRRFAESRRVADRVGTGPPKTLRARCRIHSAVWVLLATGCRRPCVVACVLARVRLD
jgi:hypothetical protein